MKGTRKRFHRNQGILTEGEGTVQLTSTLRYLVLQKGKLYFQYEKEVI